jgi:hypothetical protein
MKDPKDTGSNSPLDRGHSDRGSASSRGPSWLPTRRLSLVLLIVAPLALAGCAPKQESEAVSKSGNQFLEEEKREAPKVEQATREAEASLRRLREEEDS